MANKTIHELTELTQGNVGTSQELAIYDVSDNSTKRVTVGNLFGIDEFLTADDDDEPTGQVDFTSEDDELSPTSTESVDLLTGNDSWSQRFYKISQMFKNIRYILGKLGTTDISSIGNSTVTGAISELNSNFQSLIYTQIQSGENLNNLTNIGFYGCPTSTIASSLINCPVSDSNFAMIILRKSGSLITQVIYSGTTIYSRTKTSSGFNNWYKFTGTAN